MQLIDNWKQALSMTSVQAGCAIAVLGVAEQLMPQLQTVLQQASGYRGPFLFAGRAGAASAALASTLFKVMAKGVTTSSYGRFTNAHPVLRFVAGLNPSSG